MKIHYLITFCFLVISAQQHCAQAPAPKPQLVSIEEAGCNQDSYQILQTTFQILSADRLEQVAELCRKAQNNQNISKLASLGQYLNRVTNSKSPISHRSCLYLKKHNLIDAQGNIITQ